MHFYITMHMCARSGDATPGSAMFNLLVIVALSAIAASQGQAVNPGSIDPETGEKRAAAAPLKIDWRPLTRDASFYLGSIVLLCVCLLDGQISVLEVRALGREFARVGVELSRRHRRLSSLPTVIWMSRWFVRGRSRSSSSLSSFESRRIRVVSTLGRCDPRAATTTS